MSKSIRIGDKLAAQAETASALAHRSPPQQIEHWAQIGRVLDPVLSYSAEQKIKRVSQADLDAALAAVETKDGVARGQSVIRRTGGSSESSDDLASE
jgi:hypothetical protein